MGLVFLLIINVGYVLAVLHGCIILTVLFPWMTSLIMLTLKVLLCIYISSLISKVISLIC